MNPQIVGHTKQIAFLHKSIETGKIAHAFIFSGPSFVGKKMVAREFAFSLLNLKPPSPGFVPDETNRVQNHPLPEAGEEKMKRTFHPDFLEISGDEGIKIEQIRELIYKLSLRPYQAKYKVALIDNAENLTIESQNALLKTLEEPKSYTVLILVTSNPGKLLRTISSRAQKINFGPVKANEYENLIPEKLDKQTKELVLTLAAGKPGLAVTIVSDEEFVDKLKSIDDSFAVIRSGDMPEKLKLAYELADLETVDLKQTLDFLLIRFEQDLIQSPEIKNARNVSEVSRARRMLDQNVNSKLLLTNLMLNLN
jgi:DNA polymerase-3 subunit delta'